MKKRMMDTLLLAVMLLTVSVGFAQSDPLAILAISAEGPLEYELPEESVIAPGVTLESYQITWKSIENVHAYCIGVTQAVEAIEGDTMFLMVDGWMGSGNVKDENGTEFAVERVIFDSIELHGDAREVDIAQILNAFCPDEGETPIGTYVM